MATDPVPQTEAGAFGCGSHTWHGHSALAQVVAGWQWIRLAHVRAPSYLVLLKISLHADEQDAVRALEWWLQSPGREDGDVIEVV
jgi:hypothetical protein